MLTLYDPTQLTQVLQPALNTYLTQRFNDYPECCIVLSIGDTLEGLTAETGYHFPKDAEYVRDHSSFFKAVFIATRQPLADTGEKRGDPAAKVATYGVF